MPKNGNNWSIITILGQFGACFVLSCPMWKYKTPNPEVLCEVYSRYSTGEIIRNRFGFKCWQQRKDLLNTGAIKIHFPLLLNKTTRKIPSCDAWRAGSVRVAIRQCSGPTMKKNTLMCDSCWNATWWAFQSSFKKNLVSWFRRSSAICHPHLTPAKEAS